MKLSLEEIRFVQELREKGLSDREISWLLIRKNFTTENLIDLYRKEYANRDISKD